jgi:hypothetical protein
MIRHVDEAICEIPCRKSAPDPLFETTDAKKVAIRFVIIDSWCRHLSRVPHVISYHVPLPQVGAAAVSILAGVFARAIAALAGAGRGIDAAVVADGRHFLIPSFRDRRELSRHHRLFELSDRT